MKFVVRYRGMVVGVFDDFMGAYEAINPNDDLTMYELVVVEESNVTVTEMLPKTIKVIVAASEY